MFLPFFCYIFCKISTICLKFKTFCLFLSYETNIPYHIPLRHGRSRARGTQHCSVRESRLRVSYCRGRERPFTLHTAVYRRDESGSHRLPPLTHSRSAVSLPLREDGSAAVSVVVCIPLPEVSSYSRPLPQRDS